MKHLKSVEHVRTLVVHLEKNMEINMQVSRSISTCSRHLINCGLMNYYLTQPVPERVVNGMVYSLDYCCSVPLTMSSIVCRLAYIIGCIVVYV